MSIALDLGAHACRSLRYDSGRLIARRSRSLVALVRDTDLARAWLERLSLPCATCDNFLLVPGDAAEQLGGLFGVSCQDLLADGLIPYDDPVTRQLLGLVVDGLLPLSRDPREICCFAQPGEEQATQATGHSDLDRRRHFVSRLIRLRGYEPRAINPARALVLAEMEPERFTGVGVSLGASGADIVLAHRGNAVATMWAPVGGRWIDEQLARETGRSVEDPFGEQILDIETARRFKEQQTLDGPSDDTQKVLLDAYRRLARELALAIERLVATHALLVQFSRPLTVVCGGGPARMPGFRDLLFREFERRLPSDLVGVVRLERPDETNVARGCLIQAVLEAEAPVDRTKKSA